MIVAWGLRRNVMERPLGGLISKYDTTSPICPSEKRRRTSIVRSSFYHVHGAQAMQKKVIDLYHLDCITRTYDSSWGLHISLTS